MAVLALLGFALGAACTVWEGYVLQALWAWHVVPVFGMKEISVAQGVAIAAILGMLTHQVPADEEDRWAKVLVWGAVSPATALLVGWICK